MPKIELLENSPGGLRLGGERCWRFILAEGARYEKMSILDMNPKAQIQIIDLLTWVKERGLSEETERWLCPFTRRIRQRAQMKSHQVRTALPIPTLSSLRSRGMCVSLEDVGELKLARSHRFLGAGVGESEALLSMLHQLRHVHTIVGS